MTRPIRPIRLQYEDFMRHVYEQGAHHELVARSGLYARLAALQFGEAA